MKADHVSYFPFGNVHSWSALCSTCSFYDPCKCLALHIWWTVDSRMCLAKFQQFCLTWKYFAINFRCTKITEHEPNEQKKTKCSQQVQQWLWNVEIQIIIFADELFALAIFGAGKNYKLTEHKNKTNHRDKRMHAATPTTANRSRARIQNTNAKSKHFYAKR